MLGGQVDLCQLQHGGPLCQCTMSMGESNGTHTAAHGVLQIALLFLCPAQIEQRGYLKFNITGGFGLCNGLRCHIDTGP